MTLTYSYDQLGDETSVTDSLSSQGITTYTYDADQQLTDDHAPRTAARPARRSRSATTTRAG